jgi:UDP-N-acetyl-D-mannosaminuronic acid transferase (WecB/TagA/CpsF family)
LIILKTKKNAQVARFLYICVLKIEIMKAKSKNTGFNAPIKEKNYVVIDGKKVSRSWAAALALKGTGKILDMRAVLK